MSQKFIYINSNGFKEETPGAYEQSDFVSSGGAGSENKPIVLNGSGQLDSAMVDDTAIDHDSLTNTHNLSADIDHDTISNSHNLTTDIDHNTITNNHNLTTDINHANITGAHNLTTDIDHNTITNNHNLTTDIDHDSILNGHNLTTDIDHDSILNGHNLTTDIDHDSILNGHNLTTDIDHNTITNNHNLTTDISHDNIDGVSASTAHNAFPLLTGSRDFTGIISYDSSKNFTIDAQIVDKKYVDDQIAATGTSAEWQESCIDILLTPPASGGLSEGDRYLVNGVGTDAWSGQDYDIAEWTGSGWDFTTPTTGTFVSVDDETDGIYYFGGSGPWTKKEFEALTASYGVEIVDSDIRLDLVADGGVIVSGTEVRVAPSAFASEGLTTDLSHDLSIDWSTAFNDSKAVKASDLASVSNGYGASIIGIEDVGTYTDQTDVEGALQEIYGKIQEFGTEYTVDGSGVTKGDLLYISANNTVTTMPISAGVRAIGIAASTESSGTVKVLGNDTIVTDVLTSATAGDKYYWDGSGLTTTIPTGSGNYIWLAGIAKNSTDLQVETEFIFRRS